MRLPQLRLRIALLLTSLSSILLSIPPLMGSDAPPPPADMIIVNARIYTVNPHQKWAEAIAVRGDEIIAAGDRKQIEALRGPATRVIDAGQRLLFRGFTASHILLMVGSLGLARG